MEIRTIQTIDFDDIRKEFNLGFNDFDFTDMVENDSYVIFDCDGVTMSYLLDSIEWERYHGNTERLNKLMNDLALLQTLRDIYHIEDEVLIYVSW